MADSAQFDVRWIGDTALPYDAREKELSDKPRLVSGENMWVHRGKLAKRPAFTNTSLPTVTRRIDRLVVYETIENTPRLYYVTSQYNSGTGLWELWYIRPDAGTPTWTQVTLRDNHKSTVPHEILVHSGRCWVRATTTTPNDPQGTVLLDGTGGTMTIRLWGTQTILTAARRTNPAGWSASSNDVNVRIGWKYAVAYKTGDGHYSVRSPIETDPSQNPSDTGAFTNKKPAITYLSTSTTYHPEIGIFRTMDGGGTFFHVEDVPNPGAGVQTYTDQHRVSTTTNDPKQDGQLDTTFPAPSLVSNLAPPPVVRNGVKSYGDIMDPCTNLASHAGRIWYGIGNTLFYSGKEEILTGIPEHSFPSPYGTKGNYYTFAGEVRGVQPGGRELYVLTSREIHAITGQDRTNFLPIRVSTQGASRFKAASCSFQDVVFYLTDDLQLAAVAGRQEPRVLSSPLNSELSAAIKAAGANAEVHIRPFSADSIAMLGILVTDRGTIDNTKLFVYDLTRNAWFTPWTGVPFTAMAFERKSESLPEKYWLAASWDGTNATITYFDLTTAANVAWSYTTNLFEMVAGNHINALRLPAHSPMLSYLVVERTKYSSDSNPTVAYRLDEFSGTTTAVEDVDPPYTAQSESYKMHWYPVQLVCRRAQMVVSGSADAYWADAQNLGFVFQPEVGS